MSNITVKELKDILKQFDDNLTVLIPQNINLPSNVNLLPYIPATCVIRGFNELDGYIIIDDYSEED